jgi:hypothetical protein
LGSVNSPIFIRLRQNTLQLAAGMDGGANRVEARKSEDGLATTQFRKIPRRLRRGASLAFAGAFINSNWCSQQPSSDEHSG